MGFDGHPEASSLGIRRLSQASSRCGRCLLGHVVHTVAARVFVEVLYQSRRRIGIQVIDQGLVSNVDLPALDEGGYRDDHRELLWVAPKIVGHGDDGFVIVSDQDHLRGFVEELRVGLGHVESAKGSHRSLRECRRQDESRQDQ